MNKLVEKNELKAGIFYFVSEVVALIDKKLQEIKLLENYSMDVHHKFLDFFTATINSKVEQFCHKNKDAPSIIVKNLIFCIVCLIDEFFINEKPEIRPFWTAENLEVRMFQSQWGGDKFYENIATYLKDLNNTNKNLLLIYFLCLKCGFKGNLRGDLTQIKQIESKIHIAISSEQGDCFPTIKRQKFIKKLSFLKKIVLMHNSNFVLINLVVGLLFMLSCGVYWKYQTLQLTKFVNNYSKKVL